jgi:hypothetical protein
MMIINLGLRTCLRPAASRAAAGRVAPPTSQEASGRPFSELDADQQRALLKQVLEAESPIAPDVGG